MHFINTAIMLSSPCRLRLISRVCSSHRSMCRLSKLCPGHKVNSSKIHWTDFEIPWSEQMGARGMQRHDSETPVAFLASRNGAYCSICQPDSAREAKVSEECSRDMLLETSPSPIESGSYLGDQSAKVTQDALVSLRSTKHSQSPQCELDIWLPRLALGVGRAGRWTVRLLSLAQPHIRLMQA